MHRKRKIISHRAVLTPAPNELLLSHIRNVEVLFPTSVTGRMYSRG